jgi:hypothetical protein
LAGFQVATYGRFWVATEDLTDTMKFIQEKLPGVVNYMVYRHDNITGIDAPPQKARLTLTQVSADAGRCSISFHSRFDIDVKSAEGDHEILLKQVREISLSQKETVDQRAFAKNGHPEHAVKIDPPIALVLVKWVNANKPSADDPVRMFYFYDETLAERVSIALKHAVSLCGGGKPETF